MLESLLGSSCSRKIIVVTLFLSLSLLFLLLYPVFKVPASVPRRFYCIGVSSVTTNGGLKWTRTIDLTLIRRAL